MDFSRTAQDMMNTGEWVLMGVKSIKMESVYYYRSKNKGTDRKMYRVHKIYGASRRGVPILWLFKTVCRILRKVFNVVFKGAGESIFTGVIDEADEMLQARKHRLRIGSSVTLYGRHESVEKCVEVMGKDFSGIIKREEGKK